MHSFYVSGQLATLLLVSFKSLLSMEWLCVFYRSGQHHAHFLHGSWQAQQESGTCIVQQDWDKAHWAEAWPAQNASRHCLCCWYITVCVCMGGRGEEVNKSREIISAWKMLHNHSKNDLNHFRSLLSSSCDVFGKNQHTRELISAQKTSHKHNNKKLSCL